MFVSGDCNFLLDCWFQGPGSPNPAHRNCPSEPSSGLLSRWLSSHYHGGVHDEKSVARHTVNLLTSTIKVDADQSDLRFCFRIISPTKNYTLQVSIFIYVYVCVYFKGRLVRSFVYSMNPEFHFILDSNIWLEVFNGIQDTQERKKGHCKTNSLFPCQMREGTFLGSWLPFLFLKLELNETYDSES